MCVCICSLARSVLLMNLDFFLFGFDLSQFRMRHACQAHVHRIYLYFFFFSPLSLLLSIYFFIICVWVEDREDLVFAFPMRISSPFFSSSLHLIISRIETIFSFFSWFESNDGFVVSLMCRSRCHVNTDNIKYLNAALYHIEECVCVSMWM